MNAPQPQSLPMYFPPGFAQSHASFCAALVVTAYDQYQQWSDQGCPTQGQFVWTPKGPSISYGEALWGTVTVFGCDFPEPFGFVAWDGNGNAFIVFRGTMTSVDAIVDAEVDQTPYDLVSGYGNVQVGWYGVYKTMSSALLAQLAGVGAVRQLFITGHSMGAALSSLAIPDVAAHSTIPPGSGRAYLHYNFASPRVGDVGFAQGMNWNVKTTTFRIVNTEDLVPGVPLPLIGSTVYQHFGTPVDFTAEYLTTDGNHSMVNCYQYAISHYQQPQGPVSVSMLFNRQIRFEALPGAAERVEILTE